jgi:DNA-binding response OmpR family regulator
MSNRELVTQLQDDVIETGDFRINVVARSASVGGSELDLSSEEFDLLMFLLSHPKKMVTPTTVLSTSWPGHGIRHTDFLRVLLSLRQKLDETGGHYLRTEPWVVYQFDPAP